MKDTTDIAIPWQRPLIDLLWAVARRRNLLLLLLGAGLLLGAVKYLRTPATYRAAADAVLLPREKPTVDFVVMASSMKISEDSAKRADSASLMLPAQTDLYISLLGSRAVLEQIALDFAERLTDSSPVREDDRSDEIVERLRRMIRVSGSDEGMLTVTVTAGDPELAADIANKLIAEGQEASKSIERQLLMQQAGYLTQAVVSAREKLELGEQELKDFCERNAIIHPEMQASDMLRQIHELTAARDRARSKMAQRRVSFTDADHGIIALKAEIETANRRLEELRGQIAGDVGEREYGDLWVAYQGLVQEVRFRRDLLATLSTQADVFQIRAEQPAGNIAVVRPAVPMQKPAGPSKKKIFGIALGAALVFGVGLCLLLDQFDVLRADSGLFDRLLACRDELLRPLRFGRPMPRSERGSAAP